MIWWCYSNVKKCRDSLRNSQNRPKEDLQPYNWAMPYTAKETQVALRNFYSIECIVGTWQLRNTTFSDLSAITRHTKIPTIIRTSKNTGLSRCSRPPDFWKGKLDSLHQEVVNSDIQHTFWLKLLPTGAILYKLSLSRWVTYYKISVMKSFFPNWIS